VRTLAWQQIAAKNRKSRKKSGAGILPASPIYASKPQWRPPHESEAIESGDRERIRSNVSQALTFMEIRHQFSK
jgi:hypothetical protein